MYNPDILAILTYIYIYMDVCHGLFMYLNLCIYVCVCAYVCVFVNSFIYITLQ